MVVLILREAPCAVCRAVCRLVRTLRGELQVAFREVDAHSVGNLERSIR